MIAQLVLVIFAGSRMKGDRIALGRPDPSSKFRGGLAVKGTLALWPHEIVKLSASREPCQRIFVGIWKGMLSRKSIDEDILLTWWRWSNVNRCRIVKAGHRCLNTDAEVILHHRLVIKSVKGELGMCLKPACLEIGQKVALQACNFGCGQPNQVLYGRDVSNWVHLSKRELQ